MQDCSHQKAIIKQYCESSGFTIAFLLLGTQFVGRRECCSQTASDSPFRDVSEK